MLNILAAIVSGLIVGTLALWLYPADVGLDWVQTILLGIGGSLLAALVSARRGEWFGRGGCLLSIVGAMVLIFLARWLAAQG